MQILVTSDGKYRPCSKHQDYITDNGRELSVDAGDTLEDAWNSSYMTDIRTHFLQDRQFEGCRECWRMQKMGLRSMRYDSEQYAGSNETQISSPVAPTRIEINASNVCNLKCRICYPNASTKWIPEAETLYGKKEKVYQNLNLTNLEQVKDWSSSLEEVCFFGGEPLLSKENLGLMDHFIQTGNAHRISLLFNTNGTVFSEAIVERILQFKKVRMYFSIDDIEQRFEYQRSGAKWSEVEQNIAKAYELSRSEKGKNIEFKICCTVSSLNIYYFPEYFEYFGSRFPGLMVFWNLLFDPWRLSVQLLPNDVKRKVKERLENFVKVTYEMSEPETKTIAELITFLEVGLDRPFDEFYRYVHRHDMYRKESFLSVCPEFWSVLEQYCPSYLVWQDERLVDAHEKTRNLIQQAKSNVQQSNIEYAETLVIQAAQTLIERVEQAGTVKKWSMFEQHRNALKDTGLLAVFFRTIFSPDNVDQDIHQIYLEQLDQISSTSTGGSDKQMLKRNLLLLAKACSQDSTGSLTNALLETDMKEMSDRISTITDKQLETLIELHHGPIESL